MNNVLARILNNKHTTIAAGVYIVAAEIVPKLGGIWLPHFAEQFDATGKVIKDAALGYGLLMSGEPAKQQDQTKQ